MSGSDIDHDALAELLGDPPMADLIRTISTNDAAFKELTLTDGEGFIPLGDDLGWLGYAVGRSNVLEALSIQCVPDIGIEQNISGYIETCRTLPPLPPGYPRRNRSERQITEDFMRELGQNNSIRRLSLAYEFPGGGTIRLLRPFLNNNHNLTELALDRLPSFGREEARFLSLALGERSKKSLETIKMNDIPFDDASWAEIFLGLSAHPQIAQLHLQDNDFGNIACVALAGLLQWTISALKVIDLSGCVIDDASWAEIFLALSVHPQIAQLHLRDNIFGRNAWAAIAALLKSTSSTLEVLDLSGCEIDDDKLAALAGPILNSKQLVELDLAVNPSISASALCAFVVNAVESTTLKDMLIYGNSISDETAFAVASTLKKNHTLKSLILTSDLFHDGEFTISREGWWALEECVCDVSSINATYSSNHTLERLGSGDGVPEFINAHLRMNRIGLPRDVAMCKIFKHHPEIDAVPFLEWELKVLPLLLDWLELGREVGAPVGAQKCTTVFNFVRALPILVASKLSAKHP